MRSHIISTLLIVICLVAAGCQGAAPDSLKEVSAATSVQDVTDAWNLHCAHYNFAPAGTTAGEVTLGAVHSGSDFNADIHGLLGAMQIELDSIYMPPVDTDDLLSAVLNDPVWFR